MEAMNKIMHSSNTSHSLLNEFTINMYKDKLSRPRLEVRPFTLGSTTIIKVKRRKNQTKHDPPPGEFAVDMSQLDSQNEIGTSVTKTRSNNRKIQTMQA